MGMKIKKHKNTGKELDWPKEVPKVKIHFASLRATHKNLPNWKTPGHDDIDGYWFKKFTSI